MVARKRQITTANENQDLAIFFPSVFALVVFTSANMGTVFEIRILWSQNMPVRWIPAVSVGAYGASSTFAGPIPARERNLTSVFSETLERVAHVWKMKRSVTSKHRRYISTVHHQTDSINSMHGHCADSVECPSHHCAQDSTSQHELRGTWVIL